MKMLMLKNLWLPGLISLALLLPGYLLAAEADGAEKVMTEEEAKKARMEKFRQSVEKLKAQPVQKKPRGRDEHPNRLNASS